MRKGTERKGECLFVPERPSTVFLSFLRYVQGEYVHTSQRVACVLLACCLRVACVLLACCLRVACVSNALRPAFISAVAWGKNNHILKTLGQKSILGPLSAIVVWAPIFYLLFCHIVD
jgi:hypothetical protein